MLIVVELYSVMTSDSRPITAGHDWPLYGNEYGRIMFGNVPTDGQM
jgi:hypothetical protein